MIITRIIYFTNGVSCDIKEVEIDPPPNQSAVNPPSVCCTPCHSSMCKYRKSDVPNGTSLFSLSASSLGCGLAADLLRAEHRKVSIEKEEAAGVTSRFLLGEFSFLDVAIEELKPS